MPILAVNANMSLWNPNKAHWHISFKKKKKKRQENAETPSGLNRGEKSIRDAFKEKLNK